MRPDCRPFHLKKSDHMSFIDCYSTGHGTQVSIYRIMTFVRAQQQHFPVRCPSIPHVLNGAGARLPIHKRGVGQHHNGNKKLQVPIREDAGKPSLIMNSDVVH